MLAAKRSLNVNIFLKQFRNEKQNELINDLAAGYGSKLGLERLRALLRILPDDEEVLDIRLTIDKALLSD